MRYLRLFETFTNNEYYEKISKSDAVAAIQFGSEKDAFKKLEKRAIDISSKFPDASIEVFVKRNNDQEEIKKHYGNNIKNLPEMLRKFEFDHEDFNKAKSLGEFKVLETKAFAIINIILPINDETFTRFLSSEHGIYMQKNRTLSPFLKLKVLITHHHESYYNAMVKSELDILATQPGKLFMRKKEFITRRNLRFDFFKCDSIRSISVLISDILADKVKYSQDLINQEGDDLAIVFDTLEDFSS